MVNEKITRDFDKKWGTNLAESYDFGNGLSSDQVWDLLESCVYDNGVCTNKKRNKLIEVIDLLPESFPFADTSNLDINNKIDIIAGMASEFNHHDIIWFSIDGIKGYMNKDQKKLESKLPDVNIYWVASPYTLNEIRKHFKGRKTKIEELSTKPKMPIGHGVEHVVYPSLKDPSKVFKMAYSEDEGNVIKFRNSVIETFEKYPDIFPKIFRKSDKYVVLERLNTERAEKEYDLLNQVLEKDDELYMGDFSYTLFLVFRDYGEEVEREIDNYFANQPSPIPKLYRKWKNLIKRFFEIMPQTYHTDLHIGQFGYTKDGKLKILDF